MHSPVLLCDLSSYTSGDCALYSYTLGLGADFRELLCLFSKDIEIVWLFKSAHDQGGLLWPFCRQYTFGSLVSELYRIMKLAPYTMPSLREGVSRTAYQGKLSRVYKLWPVLAELLVVEYRAGL